MSGLTIRQVQMRVQHFDGAPIQIPGNGTRIARTVGSGSLAVTLQVPEFTEDLDDLAAAREAENDIARHGAIRWEDLDEAEVP